VQYVPSGTPIYLIDPKPTMCREGMKQFACGASEGMRRVIEEIKNL
jgi:hypothetical protein